MIFSSSNHGSVLYFVLEIHNWRFMGGKYILLYES